MKKSMRIALVAAVLMFVAPLPSFAMMGPGGGDPVPMPQSSISLAIAVILSVLGL